MAILNFTGATTASTSEVGYFTLFDYFSNYSLHDYEFWGGLYTTSAGQNSNYDDFNTAAYSFKTTNNAYSLASYFNTALKISASDTWNFSANADYIDLNTFELLSYDSSTYLSFIGAQTYEDDIINAGAGSDYINLGLDFYYYDYKSTTFKQLADQVLDGGYKTTINAGAGNDTINADYWQEDYTVNKLGTTTVSTVIPVAVINGDGGNDTISVNGLAGIINGDTPGATTGGADFIESSSFSDRIFGGAGADVIEGSSEDYFDSPASFKQALIQKDLITGNAGRDTFVIGMSNAYGLNGANDFALITDFQSGDRIASIFYRGDLLIDGTDRTISLAATSTYAATTLTVTAAIYLDSDNSGTLSTTNDELLMYVGGYQPTAANFIYGL